MFGSFYEIFFVCRLGASVFMSVYIRLFNFVLVRNNRVLCIYYRYGEIGLLRVARRI